MWCRVVMLCGRRVFKHPVWSGDAAALPAEQRRVLVWCTGEFHTDQVTPTLCQHCANITVLPVLSAKPRLPRST